MERYRRVFASGSSGAYYLCFWNYSPDGTVLFPGEVDSQTRVIFERIGAALEALGAEFSNVIETRVFVTDISQWEKVGRVHGKVFGTIKPATCMVEVARLTTLRFLSK